MRFFTLLCDHKWYGKNKAGWGKAKRYHKCGICGKEQDCNRDSDVKTWNHGYLNSRDLNHDACSKCGNAYYPDMHKK